MTATITAAAPNLALVLLKVQKGDPSGKVSAAFVLKFSPIYTILSQKTAALKAAKKSLDQCITQIYTLLKTYLTANFAKEFLLLVKKNLTPTEWQAVRVDGASLFLWSKYNL